MSVILSMFSFAILGASRIAGTPPTGGTAAGTLLWTVPLITQS